MALGSSLTWQIWKVRTAEVSFLSRDAESRATHCTPIHALKVKSSDLGRSLELANCIPQGLLMWVLSVFQSVYRHTRVDVGSTHSRFQIWMVLPGLREAAKTCYGGTRLITTRTATRGDGVSRCALSSRRMILNAVPRVAGDKRKIESYKPIRQPHGRKYLELYGPTLIDTTDKNAVHDTSHSTYRIK